MPNVSVWAYQDPTSSTTPTAVDLATFEHAGRPLVLNCKTTPAALHSTQSALSMSLTLVVAVGSYS